MSKQLRSVFRRILTLTHQATVYCAYGPSCLPGDLVLRVLIPWHLLHSCSWDVSEKKLRLDMLSTRIV